MLRLESFIGGVEVRQLVVDELNAIVPREGAEVEVLRGLDMDITARIMPEEQDGDDVTGEHRVVLAERLDGDRLARAGPVRVGRDRDPGDDREDLGRRSRRRRRPWRSPCPKSSTKEMGMTAEPMKMPIMRYTKPRDNPISSRTRRGHP